MRFLNDRNISIALNHASDLITLLTALAQVQFYQRSISYLANDHHSDAHVKGAIHLRFRHAPNFLHQREDWQYWPTVLEDLDGRSFRQDARNIVDESAACNVRKTFDDS